LEQAKGYVKVLEKLTSPVFSLREVFEHGTESYSASRERLKVVLEVLSFVLSGEPDRTRTRGTILISKWTSKLLPGE
jgi:hypothetical protein